MISAPVPASVSPNARGHLQGSMHKAKDFLVRNARNMVSLTEDGIPIHDNFAQLLILDITKDRRSKNCTGPPTGTDKTYPDDLDTTSLALILLPSKSDVYFDDTRRQTDATVCVNVVRCFYHHGRGNEPALGPTKVWICATLMNRAYIEGTRYYPSPDAFLFFFARLLEENPDSDIHRVAFTVLRARVMERANAEADALALGMRMYAFNTLGVDHDDLYLQRLLQMQQDDGSWPTGWLCRYGKTGTKLGNKYLTTALAAMILEMTSMAESRVNCAHAGSMTRL
ncbi:hypothetical protein C8R47DRAFT_1130088 [Mycena vitilis]|nr:hypothetical protein C8R47DRAFT_1130088 [Mycena vitilis]